MMNDNPRRRRTPKQRSDAFDIGIDYEGEIEGRKSRRPSNDHAAGIVLAIVILVAVAGLALFLVTSEGRRQEDLNQARTYLHLQNEINGALVGD